MTKRLIEIVADSKVEGAHKLKDGKALEGHAHPVGDPLLVIYKGDNLCAAISAEAQEYAPTATAYSRSVPSGWPGSHAGHKIVAVQFYSLTQIVGKPGGAWSDTSEPSVPLR